MYRVVDARGSGPTVDVDEYTEALRTAQEFNALYRYERSELYFVPRYTVLRAE